MLILIIKSSTKNLLVTYHLIYGEVCLKLFIFSGGCNLIKHIIK
nr:MAG TPA: hypothetical protein [Caudoviricetes sp.]